MIDRYRFVFQNVILIKYQYGRFGLNSLKTLDFSGVLSLQVQHNLLSFWSQALKRVVDIVAFFFGLLALSPFLGLIIVLIKIDSPGGVFFRQPRLGKDGWGFVPLKFRTMHRDADQVLKEKLALDPELRKEWDRYQKLKNDLRITRMGRFLRKFSLDELTQLWNVLVGEMSLVGPCPMMVDQRELYGDCSKIMRRLCRASPGCGRSRVATIPPLRTGLNCMTSISSAGRCGWISIFCSRPSK